MSAPEWITDRLPTEADADGDGEVVVLGSSECGDSYYVYSHWTLVQPGEGWYVVSNEEPELTQRPRWITDRQPTEADGNRDGAVRIRKYPKKSMGAHVHWTHIGPGVPWEHTNDWANDAGSQTDHQEEVETPVVLAAGQVWKRSDGKTVTLAEPQPNCFDDGEYWYDQGSVHAPGLPGMVGIHLAEHLEFVPAEQEAKQERPVLLEVGQTWRRSDGKIVTLTLDRDGDLYDGDWCYDPCSLQVHGISHELSLVERLDAQPVKSTARTFASLRRTYLPDLGSYIIDVVADDGTAWSRTVEIGSSGEWYQHPPLPQPGSN